MSQSESEERTKNIKLNILWSIALKTLGVGISFILLPMTVHYLNQVEYGIWVTLFSVMNWVNFLDMGIGLGLRNKLAEAVSKNNLEEIRTYMSTGVITTAFIGIILLLIFLVGIQFIDFQKFFNTTDLPNQELYQAVLYTGIFVILTFILSVINQIYYAYQKAAMTGAIQIVHNLIMLGIVYWLTLQPSHGLFYFVLSFGVATVVSKVFFIIVFFWNRQAIIPQIKYLQLSKVKAISNIGIKFFIMQLACILGFSSSNIVITQLLGPSYVRSYDVVFKIFSIITMVHALIVTPLWSAYTDAYVKQDIMWIKKILQKLNWLMVPVIIMVLILGINIDFIVKLWIGIQIDYSNTLVYLIGIYTIIFIWNSNYACLLNGIGKVDVQMIGWVSGAALIVPLSLLFVKQYGMENEGVILAVIGCLLINSVITPIHAYHILNKFTSKIERP